MVKLARYIDDHISERLTLATLSGIAGLSPARLQKQFSLVFGVSPKTYQDQRKRGVFKDALQAGESITSATYTAGYGSSSRVVGPKGANIGMTPTAYKAGGAGEVIHWTFTPSSTGIPTGGLMMAATERGVCFVQFGDSAAGLLCVLAREFPNARLIKATADARLQQWMAALDAHLEKRSPCPTLPLDLRGTAFQVLVWNFLLAIPSGQTRSYRDVAQGIGKPTAARAVAAACAANSIAVLVPCHRILRSDGGLSGYRWGPERKKALLRQEGSGFRGSTGPV